MINLTKNQETKLHFTPDQFCAWLHGYVLLNYRDTSRFPSWMYDDLNDLFKSNYNSQYIIMFLKGFFDSGKLQEYDDEKYNKSSELIIEYMDTFFTTDKNNISTYSYSSYNNTYFDDGQEA